MEHDTGWVSNLEISLFLFRHCCCCCCCQDDWVGLSSIESTCGRAVVGTVGGDSSSLPSSSSGTGRGCGACCGCGGGGGGGRGFSGCACGSRGTAGCGTFTCRFPGIRFRSMESLPLPLATPPPAPPPPPPPPPRPPLFPFMSRLSNVTSRAKATRSTWRMHARPG